MPRRFKLDTLLGQQPAVQSLKTALQAGSLPHAILLCAPDGCGRNYAARCLAADALFPEGGPGAEAVLRGESSEVLTVAGEGKSGQIPVARIREIRNDIFHSALSAAGRAVHIRDAHKMAAPAYNALLKVLEEPPADALFILTAQSPAALPATILSRCASYTLTAPGPAACQSLLAAALPPAAAPELAELLCTLYDARPGLGLAVIQKEGRLEVMQSALAAAKAAAARDSYGLLSIFSHYEGGTEDDREVRSALLGDLTDAFSAAMRGAHCPGLPGMPPAAAALLLPPVAEARRALAGNGAPGITLTALAVKLVAAGKTTVKSHSQIHKSTQ